MLLQVVLSASVLALLLMVGFSLHWQSALIVGLGLAMSSTALVMSTLSSTNQLATSHGRTSLAVLTAQDMSIVPVMALIPLLAHHATETPDGSALPKVGLALGFLVIAGSMIVTPLMIRLGGSLAQRIHDEPALSLALTARTCPAIW